MDLLTENQPHDFKNPRKKSKSSSLSPEERAKLPYDPSKCDTRVWNKSFGAQCKSAKTSGCFCATHQKAFDNHGGVLREGLFNEPRYTHAFNDTENGEELLWFGVTSTQEAPQKKQRKCGCCGEYGHNKRKCPLNNSNNSILDLSVRDLKKQARDLGASDDQIDNLDDNDNVKNAAIKLINSLKITKESICPPCSDTELSEDTSDTGAGVGLVTTPIESEPEPEPEPEEEVEEEAEEEAEEEDEEDEEEDEEASQHVEHIFEGIRYTYDKDGVVYDDEFDDVGTWEDGDIVFTKYGKKQHRIRSKETSD